MNTINKISLTQTDGLPLFSEILPEHIVPAVTQAIADNKALIEEINVLIMAVPIDLAVRINKSAVPILTRFDPFDLISLN